MFDFFFRREIFVGEKKDSYDLTHTRIEEEEVQDIISGLG